MTEADDKNTTGAPSRRMALLGALSAALVPAGALAVQQHPDAAIIRLCAQHIANMDAVNSGRCDIGNDDDPVWLAYDRTREAVTDARPQTIAGMLAKARAAKHEARMPSGSESPEGCPAETWAWDLVNDLIRLHADKAI
jgi:hypothetical protein